MSAPRRGWHRGAAVLLAACLVASSGCRRDAAAERAGQLADLATDAEQKRLWREAAAANRAVGLERLAAVGAQPQPGPVTQSPAPPPGTDAILPPVVTGIRIISQPDALLGYDGPAIVQDAVDGRIDVEISQSRSVSFVARVDGKPFPVQKGDRLTIEYVFNPDPLDGRYVIALRKDNGESVFTVTAASEKPVSLTLGSIGLTAEQIEPPKNDSMDVRVTIDKTEVIVAPGNLIRTAPVALGVLASVAPSAAPSPAERTRYSLEFVGWTTAR
jgi:hypothetical protein